MSNAIQSTNDAVFRSAFEQAGAGMALIAPDGKMGRVNRAICDLLGYTEAELLAAQAEKLIHADELNAALARREKLNAGQASNFHEELSLLHRSGKTVRVLSSLSALRDMRRNPEGILWQVTDVTEQRQTEELLRHAHKMEAIGRLAGGAAHDFNNILGVILGYANLIGSELTPGDPQLENLDPIMQSAERGARLTRQLLAFSRKTVVAPVVLNLNTLLADCQKTLVRTVGTTIELEVERGQGLGNIKADPAQIEQALVNLVQNARDAMPAGGRLTITTENLTWTARPDVPGLASGECVSLTVKDTGTGMTADVLAHLYEPFFTTKEVGKGTGLGLPTVYGIVQQHSGGIVCDTAAGKGTRFQIILPRVSEAIPSNAAASPGHSPARGNETILVVEDEESLRGLAKIVLEKFGYSVLTAFDGEHALEVCKEFDRPIDMLLTDVVMPRLSGTELAQRIVEYQPKIRVLYTSGYTENVVLIGGIRDEGLAFLQKPYSPVSLLEKVRAVLDGKRGE